MTLPGLSGATWLPGVPTLRRGIVRNWDAANWLATVALDGALGVVTLPAGTWLAGLSAGERVICIFFDDSNPNDGVVLGAF